MGSYGLQHNAKGGLMKSSLEQKLTERIAEKLGIKPEEVTPELIHQMREERIYPNPTYDFGSAYGGHIPVGRRVLTTQEIKEIEQRTDEFLDELLHQE